jgi:hypothetical protein
MLVGAVKAEKGGCKIGARRSEVEFIGYCWDYTQVIGWVKEIQPTGSSRKVP